MNTITKYILGFVALAATIFFSWYFFSVIVYILVPSVWGDFLFTVMLLIASS